MRRMRIGTAGLAAAVLAIVLGSGAALAQKVRLALDFALQGQQSPFILAAEGGHFQKAGVEVQVDRGFGSADSITKVASGAYDMAFADVGAMIQFSAKQPQARVISVYQVYDVAPMVILALAKSGIKTPKDLAGKRLASPPGASSRVLFPLLAAANGVPLDSVKWIDVTPQLRETLLAQGQTDATTAIITDLAGLANLGLAQSDVSVMRYSDFGVALYGHCLVTTEDFAAKSPDVLKRVLAGVSEALKEAIASPPASIAALKKRNPLADDKVELARLESVIANAIVTERVRKSGLSAVEPARMKATVDQVAQTFGITAPQTVYRADFLPPRERLMLK